MKIKIMSVILLVFIVSFTFLLGGCGASSNNDAAGTKTTVAASQPAKTAEVANAEITMWITPLTDDVTAYYQPKADAFEKDNPNIKIKLEAIPWENRNEKMLTAVSAKQAPDIAYFNEDNYVAFANAGQIVQLDQYEDTAKYIDDLKPAPKNALFRNGHLYVMPILQTISIMFYNKDMFKAAGLDPEKPPTTWDEFFTDAKMLTKDTNNDGKIDQWGFSEALLQEGTWWLFNPWLFQAGGSYFNDDYSKITINSDAAVDALTTLVGMYGTIIDPNDMSQKVDDCISNFEQGKAAMFTREQSVISTLRKDKPDLNFGIGPVLNYKAQAAHGTSAGFGIFSQSKDPAAAAKWIGFLVNDDNLLDFDTKANFLSPRKSIDQTFIQKLNDPLMSIAVEQSVFAKSSPGDPQWQSMMKSAVLPNVQAAVLKQKTPKQAIEDMEKGMQDLRK